MVLGNHPALPLVVIVNGVVKVHGGQDGLSLEGWSSILLCLHHSVFAQEFRIVLGDPA